LRKATDYTVIQRFDGQEALMEIAGTAQRRPLILVSLLLAAFVINLDITIVNVAIPTLVRELHASNSQLQWVVDAYNLVFAALLLAAGSLSDRLGLKGFLRAGLVVFGAASIAGGLTDTARAQGRWRPPRPPTAVHRSRSLPNELRHTTN